MRILIAGGSGYLGSNIIRRFSNEHQFINISLTSTAKQAAVNVLVDIVKPLAFLSFDRPIDMIINCVECFPQRYENGEKMKKSYLAMMRNLVEFARNNSISKIIHFSINHINTIENNYQQAKFVAEGLIKNAGINYIIFKPSIIFGQNSPLDYLIDKLIAKMILFRFWSDDAKLAPVHISDVLSNIEHAMYENNCWNESYTLRGPEILRFEEMLVRKMHRRPFVLGAPNAIVRQSLISGSNIPEKMKLLLDWVNSDGLGFSRPLLRPQHFYSYK
ncbi:MAG: NAD-dependent epimerase/dehydratase family protein [Helicobacteraceae bacterium]|jgi:NADH dehydrogenase|nr:NAD-dependent epimerase/dehydratase family protein [Helicobacteraceae bacterium]